jgi:hypothetical protein
MKAVRIYDPSTGTSAIARMYDNRILSEDCKPFYLTEGQIFTDFYFRNQNYEYTKLDYYNWYYLEEEILEVLLQKNPVLQKLIETFSLEV